MKYKKRPSTTNSDTKEAALSAKMLKIDAEYSTNVIGYSSQKPTENDTATTDISQSAGGISIQLRLHGYPKHSEGKIHARSFVSASFDKYQWAEYSQERDAMFCFACRRFALSAYGNADYAFIKNGFRLWKKAHGKDRVIQKHEFPTPQITLCCMEWLSM